MTSSIPKGSANYCYGVRQQKVVAPVGDKDPVAMAVDGAQVGAGAGTYSSRSELTVSVRLTHWPAVIELFGARLQPCAVDVLKSTWPPQLPVGAPQLHAEQPRVSEKLAYRTNRFEYELPDGHGTFPDA